MSFEQSPFAKSLYLAGTPKKTNVIPVDKPSHSDLSSSSLLKDSVRRRSSGAFDLHENRSPNASFLSGTKSQQHHEGSFITPSTPRAQTLGSSDGLYLGKSVGINDSNNKLEDSSVLRTSNNNHHNTPSSAANKSVWGTSPISSKTRSDLSTPKDLTAKRFSSIDGTPVKTPPNAYSPSQKEAPTGTWEHPLFRKVLDRRVNKEQLARKVLVNLGFLIAVSCILKVFRSVSWANYITNSDTLYSFSSVFHYIWWGVQTLLWYNVLTGSLQIALPQDKCEDIPLTVGQRELLGLPPSPKASPTSKFTPPKYVKSGGSPLSQSLRSRKSLDLSDSPLEKKRVASSPTTSPSTSSPLISSTSGSTNANTAAATTPGATLAKDSPSLQKPAPFSASPNSSANLSTSSPLAAKSKSTNEALFSPSSRFLYRDGTLRDKRSIMSRT